jgi:hypothetical protein
LSQHLGFRSDWEALEASLLETRVTFPKFMTALEASSWDLGRVLLDTEGWAVDEKA